MSDILDDHRQWLVASRKRMQAIIAKHPDGEHSFSWAGYNYSRQLCGIVARYDTGYDLTAAILDWWLDHQPGDVPPFHLRDVVEAMGNLWNDEVACMVWKEQT